MKRMSEVFSEAATSSMYQSAWKCHQPVLHRARETGNGIRHQGQEKTWSLIMRQPLLQEGRPGCSTPLHSLQWVLTSIKYVCHTGSHLQSHSHHSHSPGALGSVWRWAHFNHGRCQQWVLKSNTSQAYHNVKVYSWVMAAQYNFTSLKTYCSRKYIEKNIARLFCFCKPLIKICLIVEPKV